MKRKNNQGEEYLKAFPKFKKWINECNCCHCKGYDPNIPDQINPVEGSMGSYFIKKYFHPLSLNENGLCHICASLFNENQGK